MKIRAQIRWVLILILGLQTVVFAAPQAQSGDVGLRHDIQVLADYGAISGPVTTWPISWDAVLADLEAVKTRNTARRICVQSRDLGRGQPNKYSVVRGYAP
jgi:hypothetical protein